MTSTHQRERISAVRRGRTAGLAVGVACAVPALSVQGPAAAADQVKLGDVQQAMANLARTDGVVGAIGQVYVDGKRAGQGTAGSRLLTGKGGRIPPGFPLPDRVPDQADDGHRAAATCHVSAFRRAFVQGKLLPSSLQQEVVPPPSGGGCAGASRQYGHPRAMVPASWP